mgnify:CR=1 FL=1
MFAGFPVALTRQHRVPTMLQRFVPAMLQRFRSLSIAIATTLLAACSTEPSDHRAESAGAALMPADAVPPAANGAERREAGRKALLARLALSANPQRARNVILFIGDGIGAGND